MPVVHRIAKRGVGDVVGGQREFVDADAHVAVRQRQVWRFAQHGMLDLVFLDEEIMGGHAVTINEIRACG